MTVLEQLDNPIWREYVEENRKIYLLDDGLDPLFPLVPSELRSHSEPGHELEMFLDSHRAHEHVVLLDEGADLPQFPLAHPLPVQHHRPLKWFPILPDKRDNSPGHRDCPGCGW